MGIPLKSASNYLNNARYDARVRQRNVPWEDEDSNLQGTRSFRWLAHARGRTSLKTGAAPNIFDPGDTWKNHDDVLRLIANHPSVKAKTQALVSAHPAYRFAEIRPHDLYDRYLREMLEAHKYGEALRWADITPIQYEQLELLRPVFQEAVNSQQLSPVAQARYERLMHWLKASLIARENPAAAMAAYRQWTANARTNSLPSSASPTAYAQTSTGTPAPITSPANPPAVRQPPASVNASEDSSNQAAGAAQGAQAQVQQTPTGTQAQPAAPAPPPIPTLTPPAYFVHPPADKPNERHLYVSFGYLDQKALSQQVGVLQQQIQQATGLTLDPRALVEAQWLVNNTPRGQNQYVRDASGAILVVRDGKVYIVADATEGGEQIQKIVGNWQNVSPIDPKKLPFLPQQMQQQAPSQPGWGAQPGWSGAAWGGGQAMPPSNPWDAFMQGYMMAMQQLMGGGMYPPMWGNPYGFYGRYA